MPIINLDFLSLSVAFFDEIIITQAIFAVQNFLAKEIRGSCI